MGHNQGVDREPLGRDRRTSPGKRNFGRLTSPNLKAITTLNSSKVRHPFRALQSRHASTILCRALLPFLLLGVRWSLVFFCRESCLSQKKHLKMPSLFIRFLARFLAEEFVNIS